MRRKVRAIAVFIFGAALTAHFATAQQTINYATVGGLITDASDAVVEGAEVDMRQTDTNILSTQKTDHHGRSLFPYLKVGNYQVSIRKEGFQEAMRPVTLTVGAAF